MQQALAWLSVASLLAVAFVVGGCASVARSAAADLAENLSTAILAQDDPELVRESLPAYLLLLDSLAADADADAQVLSAAARLYAAYAVVFVTEPNRAAILARRARNYGARAICAADAQTCGLEGQNFDEINVTLTAVERPAAAALFSYAIGALAYVRTHGDDLQALADLPKIEATLARLLDIGDAADAGAVNTYLGILNSLRPPALGGDPERGRAYFDTALELTDGRDLSVLVEFARNYARLVYDRELHDALLQRVLASNPDQPGYTLFNTLAQQQARELLDSADDYF